MIFRALLIALTLFSPALAEESIPLLYTRETITINRAPRTLPWQGPDAPAPAAPPASGITFDVEVRDARSYYNQKDWFNLSGPTDDSGVLLVFPRPGQSPIIPSKHYAPLDVLFIDAQGRITQILPNIMLSNLSQQIIPQNSVLAFLFLKGQTCQRFNVNPGDIVDYKIFTRPPVVLGDPVAIMDSPKIIPNVQAIKPQIAPLPQMPPLPTPSRGPQTTIYQKSPTNEPLPSDMIIKPGE